MDKEILWTLHIKGGGTICALTTGDFTTIAEVIEQLNKRGYNLTMENIAFYDTLEDQARSWNLRG